MTVPRTGLSQAKIDDGIEMKEASEGQAQDPKTIQKTSEVASKAISQSSYSSIPEQSIDNRSPELAKLNQAVEDSKGSVLREGLKGSSGLIEEFSTKTKEIKGGAKKRVEILKNELSREPEIREGLLKTEGFSRNLFDGMFKKNESKESNY